MFFYLKRFTGKADIVSSFQIFQLLRYATFFITGIVLAKSGIALKEIGVYETLMFFSGAISFFWVSGFLTKLLSSYDNYKNNEPVLFNVFLLMFSISCLIFVVATIFQQPLVSLLQIEERENYFSIFLWYIIIANTSFINEYILLIKKNKNEMVVYGAFSFLLTIAAVSIPVYFLGNLELAIKCLIGLAVVKIVYSLILISRYEQFKINISLLSGFFIAALPLTGSLLASGSADYIDAFLVSHFFGPEQLAVFRYGAKELPLALIFANALSTAMVPFLAQNKLSKEAIEAFKNRVTRLMHLLFMVSIVLMLVCHWVYPELFNAQFEASASIFSVYLLLIISRMLFPQTLLIAAGFHTIILKASIIEIIINVLASILLLHYFGLIGVAYGTLIAFMSEKIILSYYLHSKCKISITDILPLKTYLLYSVILIGVWILMN